MTDQLQSSFSKLKDLQKVSMAIMLQYMYRVLYIILLKEHEEIHCQLRTEREQFTQSTNELRKEIQTQHVI